MGRVMGFGVGNQGFHPKARSALSPTSGARGNRRTQWTPYNPEMTAHYFVPSFSIRRHLDQCEEEYWDDTTRNIGSILGRHFEVAKPENITIKSIEQKALIHKIRSTGQQPDPTAMRDVVFNIRDGLTNALEGAPEPLEIGLGRLAVFGRNNDKLGFTLEGWKGWRARYDDHEHSGELSALGALLVESQVAVGNIATAFPDMSFSLNEIATSPHITIARTKDKIRDHELRRMQSQIDELDIQTVLFGDPVINYKLAPDEASQTLGIRHSWSSLAELPMDQEIELFTRSAYDVA